MPDSKYIAKLLDEMVQFEESQRAKIAWDFKPLKTICGVVDDPNYDWMSDILYDLIYEKKQVIPSNLLRSKKQIAKLEEAASIVRSFLYDYGDRMVEYDRNSGSE